MNLGNKFRLSATCTFDHKDLFPAVLTCILGDLILIKGVLETFKEALMCFIFFNLCMLTSDFPELSGCAAFYLH